jgi:hypothetical protein
MQTEMRHATTTAATGTISRGAAADDECAVQQKINDD